MREEGRRRRGRRGGGLRREGPSAPPPASGPGALVLVPKPPSHACGLSSLLNLKPDHPPFNAWAFPSPALSLVPGHPPQASPQLRVCTDHSLLLAHPALLQSPQGHSHGFQSTFFARPSSPLCSHLPACVPQYWALPLPGLGSGPSYQRVPEELGLQPPPASEPPWCLLRVPRSWHRAHRRSLPPPAPQEGRQSLKAVWSGSGQRLPLKRLRAGQR